MRRRFKTIFKKFDQIMTLIKNLGRGGESRCQASTNNSKALVPTSTCVNEGGVIASAYKAPEHDYRVPDSMHMCNLRLINLHPTYLRDLPQQQTMYAKRLPIEQGIKLDMPDYHKRWIQRFY